MDTQELSTTIDLYLAGEATLEKVEEATTKLINDDEFDKSPEELQDIVYALDMNDINELSNEDISNLAKRLKKLSTDTIK